MLRTMAGTDLARDQKVDRAKMSARLESDAPACTSEQAPADSY